MTTPRGVPLFDLRDQYRELGPEIEAAVCRVLASGQAINGPDVAALERELAAACGTAYGVGCASGTDAISLALHALGIGPGDEVILPAFTFFATVGCVVRCGATPVLADIDPLSYNLDPTQVENKITPRTKAIMPVHLYGQCADMDPLWRIAERNNLAIIEDAAQALGAEYKGKRAGTLGAIACLSFYPTKILGTYGDGGACVTNDPEWADRMAVLRQHGMKPKYYHGEIGWNARLDSIQAAILRVKLPHVERWVEARRAAARRYDTLIEGNHLGQLLKRPTERPGQKHVYGVYNVRVANGRRDEFIQHLKADGIGYEVYYPVPLHLQECLQHLGHRLGDFPASEEASRSVVALPMFPEITPAQQERVIDVCGSFFRQATTRRAA